MMALLYGVVPASKDTWIDCLVVPELAEHMLAFIYIARSMMGPLYGTVSTFEDAWIGSLVRPDLIPRQAPTIEWPFPIVEHWWPFSMHLL